MNTYQKEDVHRRHTEQSVSEEQWQADARRSRREQLQERIQSYLTNTWEVV